VPFGPLEGAFMAMGADGDMIEIYPDRATLDIPANDDQVVFGEKHGAAANLAFPYVPVGAARTTEAVEAIGAREGWRAKTFGPRMQGHDPFFHVIEFWIEKPPDDRGRAPALRAEYENFITTRRIKMRNDPRPSALMAATHIKEPGVANKRTRASRPQSNCDDAGGTPALLAGDNPCRSQASGSRRSGGRCSSPAGTPPAEAELVMQHIVGAISSATIRTAIIQVPTYIDASRSAISSPARRG